MPKKYSEMTLEKRMEELSGGLRVTTRTYPIIDSDTKLAIPDIVGKYFEIEIDYRYFGERHIVIPMSGYMHTLTFWNIRSEMSEEYAKEILRMYFLCEKLISNSTMYLDELVLGDEGDQEIHTLKAKGRVYCRT